MKPSVTMRLTHYSKLGILLTFLILLLLLLLLLPSLLPVHDDLEAASEGQCPGAQAAQAGGQRVISFSYYGPSSGRYLQGLKRNLAAASSHFPGWWLRLYVDSERLEAASLALLQELATSWPALQLCTGLGAARARNGMLWRLLPFLDRRVQVVLVRDLDSLLSAREAAAVAAWLNSSLAVHVMRDHPSHSWPMMGGMWGARLEGGSRGLLEGLVRRVLGQPLSWVWLYLADQRQLQWVVWPRVQHLALVHDSYHCRLLQGGQARPFPTQREEGEDNWVGGRKRLLLVYCAANVVVIQPRTPKHVHQSSPIPKE